MKRCICYGCRQRFNSASVFDAHRIGDWKERGSNRRCLTIAEMTARGWLQNAAGYWIRERMPIVARPAYTSGRNSGDRPKAIPEAL